MQNPFMKLVDYHRFHIMMKLFGNRVDVEVAKGWRPSDESSSIKLRHVRSEPIYEVSEQSWPMLTGPDDSKARREGHLYRTHS